MRRIDVLRATVVAVVWGANFVVLDAGLADMPPLLFVATRFVVVLFPAVLFVPRPAVGWRTVLAVGTFLSVCQFGLLYTALAAGMPAGLASLVLQAQVMFTVAIAWARLGERPTPAQLGGVALGLLGLVVVGTGRAAATPLTGLLLTLAAALSWATGNVVVRRAGVASGLSLTVWSAVVVPVPMLALSLVVDGPRTVGHALTHVTLVTVLSTAYTAYLSSLFGYTTWSNLLARYPSSLVVPFTLLVPPVGMLTAWLVEGERPGPAELAGGVLVLAGVAVTVTRGGRAASTSGPGDLPGHAVEAAPAGVTDRT